MRDIKDIVDFILADKNYANQPVPIVQDYVKKHLEYGTFLTVRDEQGLVAVARWNWENSTTVFILDVIVRKDYRKPQIMRQLVALGASKNPKCRFIKFERTFKYPNREPKIYSIDKLLKRKVK